MTILAFTVVGNPTPWRLASTRTGHLYSPAEVAAYKQRVGEAALAAKQRLKLAGILWPVDACYELSVVVVRKNDQRYDCDRILNCVQDGLVGVLFPEDHKAIVRAARVYAAPPDKANPRAMVRVRAMSEADADRLAMEAQS